MSNMIPSMTPPPDHAVILSPSDETSIIAAVSQAILNGRPVETHLEKSTLLNPQFGAQINGSGLNISAGLAIVRKKALYIKVR